MIHIFGIAAFVCWCVLLCVGLLFSGALYGNRAEANGSGAFGKLGFWLFGVLLALSIALRVLL